MLALGADFFGSMRTLLSIDALKPLVRSLRLDGVYPVRGFKRHYIDEPLSCTFSFPGGWVYDPMLEMALQRRKFSTYSSSPRGGSRSGSTSQAPLPLVSMCPNPGSNTGTGQSLGLFVTSAGNASTLEEALGTPQEAQAGIIRRFLAGSPPGAEAEAVSAAFAPAPVPGGREAYRFELRVRTRASKGPPEEGGQGGGVAGIDGPLSVWTTAQLAPGAGGKPAYLMLLTGVAPLDAPAEERALVRASTESLEALL